MSALALAQGDPNGFLGETGRWYRPLGGPLAPTDLIVMLLVTWALLGGRTRRAIPLLPWPLVGASMLLVVAVASGAATGFSAGASAAEILYGIRCSLYLAVVPLAVACVLDESDLDAAVRAVLLGGGVVATVGAVGWLIGRGPVIPSGGTVTFTEAAALWWLLIVLLVTACLLVGPKPPGVGSLMLALLALFVFVLSLRRGFIVAAVLTMPAIVLLATSAANRRLAVLTVAGAIAALVLAQTLLPPGSALQAPGSEAVRSLQQKRSTGDRYRRAELINVWQNVRRNPVYGLGFGVPWRTYEPLPGQYKSFRNYVHAATLWYWLKMGIFGLVAYLCYFAAAGWCGVRAWKSERSMLFRAFGLATALGMIALLIVELTATQTGVDSRLALIIGLAVGISAADATTPVRASQSSLVIRS